MTRRSTGLLVCISSIVVLLFATAYRVPAASGKARPRSGQGSQDQILAGRRLVLSSACGDCHGYAGNNPAGAGFLVGMKDTAQQFHVGPFITRPKNLTPDVATGTGSFTERQLFNALRYGLRPEDTPDLKITSATPGMGNFPKEPHYLGPFMPWASWRHMSDEDLWSIIAYLRHGVKPVLHKVELSDDAPDHWASAVATLGKHPAAPFPTVNEIKR